MAKSSKTEIVTVKAKGANAPALWSPVAGENIQELAHTLVGTSLSEDEFRRIRNESLRILKQCLPPDRRPERRTGLIIGYVQSGKTMSMTTVSALARDNKLRLFIVFAGTKKNLVEQSRFRFTRELRGSSPRLRWEMWSNPTLDEHKQELEVLAEEWDDPQLLEKDQRALFITVMKQHTHLDNLAKLLDTANLSGITALIFDDEADQAGLNTKPQEDQPSTTYRRILRIRQLIPRHTYLQYTATPQAPLLINLMDILSPEFGDVIEPGPMYTGGDHFFIKTPGLVRHIPDEEALDVASEEAVSPPESLLEALRVYFLGVAAARTRRDQGTRSMLIHPSIRQTHHSQFTTWVYEIQQRWRAVLAQNAGDPERKAEVAQFKSAYKSLKETAPSIAPLDDLLPRLRTLIGRTVVTEVNSRTGHEVDWSRADSHILVGGAKLERGFTLEGLTVTYMPRGRGVGNADVIQQRARFYGYKRSYLGFCRVYLPTDIEFAYRSYVEHEEDVREQIRKHRGKPLREWRRAFYLDPRFQPTRRMVLRDPYYFVGGSKSEWFKQSWPHFSPENAKANGRLVEAFCHGLRFKPWSSYPDVLVAEKVPLKKVMESLLVDYAFMGPRDRVQGVGTVIRLIELLEEDPEATCVVFLMSGGRQRKRSARSKDDDSIELHQGRSSIGEGKGYPGDEAVKRPDVVTVQIHRLSVESSQGSFRDVPGLAVRLPDVARGKTLLVQDQGLEASG